METLSGILLTGILDHLPYFVCLKNISKKRQSNPKYVKCKINKPEAIKKFLEELKENDIYGSLDHSFQTDPNKNYDKMIDHITKIKNKHLPYRFVKFNKHRHKSNKWITYGIIISHKKLCRLKKMDQGTTDYLAHKQNLKTFN